MALAALDADAAALPAWCTAEELTAFLSDPASGKTAADEATQQAGRNHQRRPQPPPRLQPGESKSVTFAITWHFPNVQRFQHSGQSLQPPLGRRHGGRQLRGQESRTLWDRTRLYHDTVYQSNLPEEFLDAMMSQSVILRGPTCFWSEDGYFAGFEGSYGCCPLNCTHVWNYAQSHARLFPAVGQNMRISNFITYPASQRRNVASRTCGAWGVHRWPLRLHRGGLSRVSAQPRPEVFGNESGPA